MTALPVACGWFLKKDPKEVNKWVTEACGGQDPRSSRSDDAADSQSQSSGQASQTPTPTQDTSIASIKDGRTIAVPGPRRKLSLEESDKPRMQWVQKLLPNGEVVVVSD
jgi:hypothetical protein